MPSLAQLQVGIEEERRRRARARRAPAVTTDHYGTWLAEARPTLHRGDETDEAPDVLAVRWNYQHFVAMQDVLDRMTAGVMLRALIEIPIRHGKTQHNTIGYAAYRIERRPSTRILVCSYNQVMADKFSRAIRKLVRARGVALSDERDAAREWETVAGGGVRALGAGTGAASLDADVVIIDDPIGSREDAESQATRDKTWDWISNDLLARAEPHTAVLMQLSRWHTDDPAGRLRDRQAGRWEILHLPGRADHDPAKGEADALGRAVHEPLWPELRGAAWLDEKRVELGEYGFASLIQGRPRPREGGMFKWDWWQLLDAVPTQGPLVRYWDLAGSDQSESPTGDATAGALLCRMFDGRTAIVDVERFRKTVAARDARVEEVARADKHTYGARVVWWIETEAGIQGKERTANLVRRVQRVGLVVHTEHPTGSKLHRAEPLASKAEAGNVVLCSGTWRDAFRLEAADFTGHEGGHDDQIDAAAGADAKLDLPRPTVASLSYRA